MMRRRASLSEDLWSRKELAVATVLCLIGSIGLVVCWWGASGERTFEDAKDWLIGAVLAAALLIFGAVFLLLAGFRRLREAKDDAVSRFLRAVPVVAAQYLAEEYLADEAPRRPAADLADASEVGVR